MAHINWGGRMSNTDVAPIYGVSALERQVGGNHYKDLKIQPVEYIMENNIPYIEGSVIKYVTRWKSKNGVEDLRKAIHFLEILIQQQEKQNG